LSGDTYCRPRRSGVTRVITPSRNCLSQVCKVVAGQRIPIAFIPKVLSIAGIGAQLLYAPPSHSVCTNSGEGQ
jgi:hypothetical protein